MTSAEMDISEKRFSDDDLRSISTFDDVVNLLSQADAVIEDFAEEYGNGFSVLPTDAKTRLIGVPLMLIEWRFTEGDNGEFVSIAAITDKNDKFIINDGSTGIRDQLKKVTETRLNKGATPAQASKGLKVLGGLRVSNYTYQDDAGKTKNASTFYLAN